MTAWGRRHAQSLPATRPGQTPRVRERYGLTR
jgi:hypothetical protein